ncbi:SGNH/GDSL hydrolase family protein [Ahrensia sp. 13_GOM-1096m]|uniref:SGNH/GDSL hydrolase family protein n=1 Tax=Ahrensia sp. 13_GOM-1096m TaxID=1380380 RepID=UPI00047A162A|nr:SGNH/GDSL hydrolase family protein [Ahrensia sp. 13_GOM-1096m]
MTTVLAYGDSLTWGSCPETGGRHPVSHRWPDVLSAALGDGVTVITNGLRGRTTAYDEYLADCDRNGVRVLPTVLNTHAPIDLVIILLGANDMKPHICGTSIGALQGVRRLTQIAKNHMQGLSNGHRAKVLIVAPPPLVESDDLEFRAMFDGGIAESKKLDGLYEKLAKDMDVAFFDAGTVAEASTLDGVHLDAENTKKIGAALAPIVKKLLAV